MKKIKNSFILILVLVLGIFLVSCEDSNGNGNDDPDDVINPIGIEFTIQDSILEVGEYTLTAKITPLTAQQLFTFSLVGIPVGVTLESNILTVSTDAVDGSTVKVKVAANNDPTIFAYKEFTLELGDIPPVVIRTEEELKSISLNGKYELGNDITLTEPWLPLGEPESEDSGVEGVGFWGVLDGKGYSIYNFSTPEGGYNKGFFYLIERDGVVKNLGFVSGKESGDGVKASSWSAVVAGSNKGLISNVYTDVLVTMSGMPGASLVGSNKGIIEYSYTIGKVKVGSGVHGSGLVNSTGSGTITESYVLDTSVTSAIGYNKEENANIKKTENWMKTAQNYIDAGWDSNIWYFADGIYPILKNENFVEPSLDPFIRIDEEKVFLDYTNENERLYEIDYEVLNSDDTDVLIELDNSYMGVTLNDNVILLTGDVIDGTSLVVTIRLTSNPEIYATINIIVNNYLSGTYVEIETVDDLIALRDTLNPEDLSKNYRLINDIDLNGIWWNYVVGTNLVDKTFNGVFDGNGYSILNIAGGGGEDDFAFFSKIGTNGVVKNLGIEIRVQRMYVGRNSAVLAQENNGLIENIIVKGEIMTTTDKVAGLVYDNNGTINNVISLVALLLNESPTNFSKVAGIAYNNTGTVSNAYVDGELTKVEHLLSAADETLDAFVKTTLEMKTLITYANFNEEVWNLVEDEYPTFKAPIYVAVILISTEEELRALAGSTDTIKLSKHYQLTNDIALTSESSNFWLEQIGSAAHPFEGIFDGNGYTISNVRNSSGGAYRSFGFFGVIGQNGVVQNLTIDTNGALYANGNSGVFVYLNYGLIQNSMTKGEIRGGDSQYISGFIHQNNGLIRNSIASVSVSHKASGKVRGAFSVSSSGTGTFDNVFYDVDIASDSYYDVEEFGVLEVKFWVSGSNNAHTNNDYTTEYLQNPNNYNETWDRDVWHLETDTYPSLIKGLNN